MPKFSEKSRQRLASCHPRLQDVLNEAIKIVDFSVICGVRGEEDQNRYFAEGKSKVKYPNGKHNSNPSRAVDIQPYPYPADNKTWFYLIGIIKGIAHMKSINIRSGADWDMDTDFNDQTFNDWFHLELV